MWCGISGHALNAKASKVVVLKCVFAFKVPLIAKAQNRGVLKCGWEVLAESYHEEGKSCGTKWGVRFR